MSILQDRCVLWYTSNASSYTVGRNLDTHHSFTCTFRKKGELEETQGVMGYSRTSQLWKLWRSQYKVCLCITETQPEKSLSSPCVVSEVDTENLGSTVSQGTTYRVSFSAHVWPEQEQKTLCSNNFPVKRNKVYATYFMCLDTLTAIQLQFLHFQFLHKGTQPRQPVIQLHQGTKLNVSMQTRAAWGIKKRT